MLNKSFLTVGSKRFHYIWLRDNCFCPECRRPNTLRKVYDISDRTSPPEPLSVEEQDGDLTILWNEDPPHRSTFQLSWLLSHAYDRETGRGSFHQEFESIEKEEILWDKAWIENHLSDYCHEADSCTFETWANQLFTLGFTVLENMSAEDFEVFLSTIGPIYHTEFGAISMMRVDLNTKPVPHPGDVLFPHNDFSYRCCPQLLTCLHMGQNDVLGGESLLVDGFRVARDFRQNHPNYFQILAATPIRFEKFYKDFGYLYRRKRYILELDEQNWVKRVNFGHAHTCDWDVPFDEMELFYEAFFTFLRYLKNPAYSHCFRLKPRNCLLLNNSRVLHGRRAFDSNSGIRDLRTAWIDWDYFVGKHNFHQFKHFYPVAQ
ncbi:TauD/TfdA family dioxygenase [Microcoleus sp. A003_D6]|uniref:TauD/TfdA family dioxygenase n=1 Tax=Microcoleus sp. A003_D6 TaxID=3055266 RepID=UPI002FCED6A6